LKLRTFVKEYVLSMWWKRYWISNDMNRLWPFMLQTKNHAQFQPFSQDSWIYFPCGHSSERWVRQGSYVVMSILCDSRIFGERIFSSSCDFLEDSWRMQHEMTCEEVKNSRKMRKLMNSENSYLIHRFKNEYS
jgi:hypothetical protein